MKCTVVVPTYNERANVEEAVRRVLLAGPEFHVLIVDDNSPDGTGQIASSIAEQEPRVRVLHQAGRRGLGTAYVNGIEAALAAGCDFVAQMDCDLSHEPESLAGFLQAALQEDADYVIGSRYKRGGRIEHWPWRRRVLSWLGNRYARTFLGAEITDYLTGFNMIRVDALRRIPYQRIGSQGFAFLLEFKYTCLRHGLRFVEMPITFIERRNGVSKLTSKIIAEGLLRVLDLRYCREWPVLEQAQELITPRA